MSDGQKIETDEIRGHLQNEDNGSEGFGEKSYPITDYQNEWKKKELPEVVK